MNQDLVLGSFIYEIILLLVNKFVSSESISSLLSITLTLILINLCPIYIVKKLYNKSKNKKLLVILALLLICTLNYLIFYPIDDELTVKSALIYCTLVPIILCIIFPNAFPAITFLAYMAIIVYYSLVFPLSSVFPLLGLILYLIYFVLLFILISLKNVKIFSIGGILLTILLFLIYLYNLELFNEKNLSLITQLLIITLICFNVVWLLFAFGESIINKLTEVFGITSLSQFFRIFGIMTLLIILSFNFQIYNDKPIASIEYYNLYELPFTPKDNEYISVEEMHDSFAANYIRAAYFETHPIEAMYITPKTTLATSKQSIDEALEKAEKHLENAYKIAIKGFKENLPSPTEIAVETVSPKVSNILDVVGGIKTAYTIYAVSQEIQKANDILLNAMKDGYSSQDNTFSSSGITYKKEMPTREEVEAMFRNIRNNLAAEYDIMLRYINKFRDVPYTKSIHYYRGVFYLDYLTEVGLPPPTELKRPKLYINLTHHDYEKYIEMREFAKRQKLILHEYEKKINKLYMANLAILMFIPNDKAILEEIGKDCAELIWVIDTLADEKPELKKVGENWIYMDDPFDIAKVEKILSYYNTSNDFIEDYNIKFNRIKSKLNKLENNLIYFTISSLKLV